MGKATWFLLHDSDAFDLRALRKRQTAQWDCGLSAATNTAIQKMSKGDRVLFLATSATTAPAILGEMAVHRAPSPDPRQESTTSAYYRPGGVHFFQVELMFTRLFPLPVPWAALAGSPDPQLAGLPDLSTGFCLQTIFPATEQIYRFIAFQGCSKQAAPLPASRQSVPVGPPEISPEDIQVGDELGSGQFGKVYYAKFRHQPAAVKVLHVHPDDLNEEELARVEMEARILQNVHCPHTIKFFGASITPLQISIVTELLPKGELGKLLMDSAVHLDLFTRLRMAWDIAAGMNWLHSAKPMQFLHLDLKPSNLLVDDNLRIKICDFGFCLLKDPQLNSAAAVGQKGTMKYMAPELLRRETFTESVDVYSFGMILWEIVTREPLFPELGPNDGGRLMNQVLAGKRPVIPPSVPQRLQALMEACWTEQAAARPSFDEIVVALTGIVQEQMLPEATGRQFWKGRIESFGAMEVEWAVFERELRAELRDAYDNQQEELPIDTSPAALHSASDYQLELFASRGLVQGGMAATELKRRYNSDYEPSLDLLLELRCLKRLLQVKQHRGKVVLQKWGDLQRWFGPVRDPTSGFPTFLQRVKRTLQLPYFHGVMSSEAAARTLRSAVENGPGGFLVRFSKVQVGSFTVSFLKENGEVAHWRLPFDLASCEFVVPRSKQRVGFYSLEAALASLVERGHFQTPVPSHTYASLFVSSDSHSLGGYELA